ncbi:UDP-N-acetylmuramate dehydrogenase [Candidatus Peregrinibacteria bacterium]|nr:UDP-N-acetylmuramate dehydrogenase [Candidatus Peregrinibacteria bacterium]
MNNLQLEFKASFPKIIFNEPLKKHCTFGIGGAADFFYPATKNKEIKDLIRFANKYKVPFITIGKGSNILFHDHGFRGLVINIKIEKITFHKDSVEAEAGASIAKLIFESIKHGFNGLEKWVGLPGTVGGAVFGNAGCNGLEVKDCLIKSTLLEAFTGKEKKVDNKYFRYKYRHSILKEEPETILSATFRLQKNKLNPEEQRKIMEEIQKFRLDQQPKGSSSGSFFKNPSKDQPAGYLIDQVHLKGQQIGQAKISEKHGNFFLNLGGATAQDILSLAQLAKEKVKERFGLVLEEEVRIIPEQGL